MRKFICFTFDYRGLGFQVQILWVELGRCCNLSQSWIVTVRWAKVARPSRRKAAQVRFVCTKDMPSASLKSVCVAGSG